MEWKTVLKFRFNLTRWEFCWWHSWTEIKYNESIWNCQKKYKQVCVFIFLKVVVEKSGNILFIKSLHLRIKFIKSIKTLFRFRFSDFVKSGGEDFILGNKSDQQIPQYDQLITIVSYTICLLRLCLKGKVFTDFFKIIEKSSVSGA